MEAVGELDRGQRGLVLEIDSLARDVVQELLDVEGIPLGATVDERHERRGRLGIPTDDLGELRADEVVQLIVTQGRERELVELRERLDAQRLAHVRARSIGEHDEHPLGHDRARDLDEQVARELVEPVAVLHHQDQRPAPGARTQARDEEILERGLAELRVERAGEVVVRQREPDDLAEQWRAGHEVGIDRAKLLLELRDLDVLRAVVRETEERAPDLAPREVARRRAVGLALTERHELAPAAGRADELGDEP